MLSKKVKTDFAEVNVLEHLHLQYNLICSLYILFFSLLQSCVNGGFNGYGFVMIFDVKIVFTYKKFSVLFAFKIHSKKITEMSSQALKKLTTIPKTVDF